MHKRFLLWSSVLAGLAAGLGAGPAAADAEDCTAMEAAAPAGVTITEAVHTPVSAETRVAHCRLRGVMDERTGMDGQPYALRFELRLPDDWQGRFMHQFNGGNDGTVVPATGEGTGVATSEPPLSRGFALVSSDAGHDGGANPDAGLAGSNMFGLDFEARRDYGYDAVATLHPVALELVERYYGRAPDYVYGYGRSNGGRHAMVAAERMPEAFDGLLAGYPGFNLPRAALQHAWDVQTFLSVGDSLATAFSRDELTLVSDAITAACDGLDGLEDGVVFATMECQEVFDPATLACGEGQNSACLPPEKVAALKKIHAGPTDSAGTRLYNSWLWDTGISTGDWRFWKLESPIPPWDNKPLIAVMGAGSLAQIFTTPPTRVGGTTEELQAYLTGFDFDTDAPKIDATTEAFPESPMEMMTPPNADDPTLSGLEESGGKLIVFHGVSDPVFSFKDTADWYARLRENNPDAADFVRFYAIPGMPHGQGGNAPDEVDMLGALVDWVERGAAPGAVTATFRPANEEIDPGNAGAGRPLCPWPQHAVYTGDDQMAADSFTCE
ncbi:tannase/feruloyl esterase family alpha/beta hydrolase [Psychromarinibacter sp. C21-152]|uniref:Tannase/feruloyl esterase family alpha/beta hydrolase n=1 Tax=Psychromarinibacter sediminicola TaxID=3033385 RepID=A0AAE3NPK9_9RHOB|nr:tannase/feruloyl esterase family alpha/beta hydrolase [Psychromarinibacter sediminicola]MDF0599771.1 tannase/feruloyl esterase family alpha/beta hydrolase [Psychromarinibacter sediminicola]